MLSPNVRTHGSAGYNVGDEYGSPPGVGLLYLSYSENNEIGGLISMTFSDLDHIIGSVDMSQSAEIVDLNFPELDIIGGDFDLREMVSLESVNLPKLSIVVGNFNVDTVGLINIPSLAYVYEGVDISGTKSSLNLSSLSSVKNDLKITKSDGIRSLSAPSLIKIGGVMDIRDMKRIESISMSNLQTVGSINLSQIEISDISLPLLKSIGGNIDTKTNRIVNFQLGTTGVLKNITGNITLTGNRLDISSVEQILNVLASLDGTNDTTIWGGGQVLDLTSGTNARVGELTSQGVIDKGIIEGRGGTVLMNESGDLTINLKDENGVNVADCYLILFFQKDIVMDGTTDINGNITFTWIPYNGYHVTVSSTDLYTQDDVDITISQLSNSLNMTTSNLADVTFHVVNDLSANLENARINVNNGRLGISDVNGLSIVRCGSGSGVYSATCRGYADISNIPINVVSGMATVEVILQPKV